ncbi:hypothetical protein K1T71_014588 [Dendrolimus kikuchii]|uniref:Uncharacterized protein n=1 Tax=Dendrolimus kikuchii TaxID=765133 RepID=A0ACC1CEI2_9NEOP|nr:hypothetical protein K1T71_014588 [Dendrolimus kikuchii]
MNMVQLILFLIISIQTVTADKEVVPAFLIDDDQVMKDLKYDANPFNKMSSTDFGDIVHEIIKRSEGVIMFIENMFCTEDLSSKDKLGTPFFHLRQGLLNKSVKYFPAVTEPYSILNQIFQPQPFTVFFLNIGTKLELPDKFKYIYVFFEDGKNESRTQALRRHDLIIKQVYFVIRQLKAGPIVAFYTGKYNPVVVEKLSFVEIEPIAKPLDQSVFIRSAGAIFKFRDVETVSVSRRSAFRQVPLVAEEIWEDNKLSTRMAYSEFELQFNFEFGPNKWMLDSVTLYEGGEEVGRTQMDVCIPWEWSYICGEPLIIANTRDGSSVTISQYQIQPLKEGNTSNETGNFGKAVNCGPYFSSHILSGLLVGFIFLGILAYGIITLSDCGTNDRFDDPNGKTFTADVGHH